MLKRILSILALTGVACGGTPSAADDGKPVTVCRHDAQGTVAVTNIGSVGPGSGSTRVRVVTGNRTTVVDPEGECVFTDEPPRRHPLRGGEANFPRTPDASEVRR